jgi:hypothetical protein
VRVPPDALPVDVIGPAPDEQNPFCAGHLAEGFGQLGVGGAALGVDGGLGAALGLVDAKERRTAGPPEDQAGGLGLVGGKRQPVHQGAQVAVAPDDHLGRAVGADGAGLDPGEGAVRGGGAAAPVLKEVLAGGHVLAHFGAEAGREAVCHEDECPKPECDRPGEDRAAEKTGSADAVCPPQGPLDQRPRQDR